MGIFAGPTQPRASREIFRTRKPCSNDASPLFVSYDQNTCSVLIRIVLVCAFSYTAPGSKFDLSKWNLQLPVNNVQTISGPKGDLDTYSSKWFWLDQQGKMVFTTITSGNHTPGSKYARSELREIFSSSDPDWSLPSKNGLHVLEATAQVTSCPTSNKKTTLGQIHTVDAKLPIVVELQWVDGKVVVMYR